MRARLAASSVALVILVTAVLPAVGGYRCIFTGERMDAVSSCCRHEDDGPALKAQCCESFDAPRVEPRRTPSDVDTILHPPALVAFIVLAPPAGGPSSADRATAARARGRPTGDELHLLSSVLRV